MQKDWNTRASLLQRAQNQEDHSAWDEFVSVYRKFIATVITKSGLNFADVDDLIQDVLVKVWKGLPNYEYRQNQAKFRTWLSVVIRNAIRDHVAKNHRSGGNQFELDDENIACELTSQAMERRIDHEWKLRITELAIEKLKTQFTGRAVDVFLMSLDGADAQHISDELGLTIDTVYSLRKRVKAALRKEIESLREDVEFH